VCCKCIAVYSSVLQCVAGCCIVLQRVIVRCSQSADRELRGSCVFKCVSICCVSVMCFNLLLCVAVWCSVLKRVFSCLARGSIFFACYSFRCGVSYVLFVCVCGYDEYGTIWLVSLQKSSVHNVLLCAAVSPRLVSSFAKETSPPNKGLQQYTTTHCNALQHTATVGTDKSNDFDHFAK